MTLQYRGAVSWIVPLWQVVLVVFLCIGLAVASIIGLGDGDPKSWPIWVIVTQVAGGVLWLLAMVFYLQLPLDTNPRSVVNILNYVVTGMIVAVLGTASAVIYTASEENSLQYVMGIIYNAAMGLSALSVLAMRLSMNTEEMGTALYTYDTDPASIFSNPALEVAKVLGKIETNPQDKANILARLAQKYPELYSQVMMKLEQEQIAGIRGSLDRNPPIPVS